MIREADKDGTLRFSGHPACVLLLIGCTGDGMIDYNEFVTMMMAKVRLSCAALEPARATSWAGVLTLSQ